MVQLRTSGYGANPSSWTITARDVDPSLPNLTDSVSPDVVVQPNTPKNWFVVVPGETWVPGKTSGLAGKTDISLPSNQTAGTSFNTTVYLVDDYFNAANLGPAMGAVTDDPNDIDPGSQLLIGGVATVPATLVTASTSGWTITASGGAYTGFTTPKIIVGPAGPSRILALLPGEQYLAGSVTGKTAALPSAQIAGTPFVVTAMITDNRWNLVSSTSSRLGCWTEDPYDVEPASASTTNGQLTFTVEFHRGVGETYRIRVSTDDGNLLSAYTTPAIASNLAPRQNCSCWCRVKPHWTAQTLGSRARLHPGPPIPPIRLPCAWWTNTGT